MLDVSIIIVNFNTLKITTDCLDSIKKYTTGIKYETIVVDNASTDGSVESLRRRKDITLIEAKENGGFSKGNNLGIAKAKGRYILLLNSDTILKKDSLEDMVFWMDKHKDVGISGCKLLNSDGSIQPNGGFFPTLTILFLWATFLDDLPLFRKDIRSYHPHIGFYDSEKELDWVTGAFFMIRHGVIEKVGTLSPKFFMYVEELEYCYRVKKAGWKIFYVPVTAIIHLGKASSTSRNAILGEFRGLQMFYKLHRNFISFVCLKVLLIKAALLRMIILGIVLRRKEAFKTYARALAIN